MDDFSPGLESLFEGVDLPFHTPTASAYIKQRDSPVFSSPSTSTSSNSAYPSPETSTISQSYSPKHKLTVEKWDQYHPTTRLYFPLFDQNYQVYEMEVRTKIDKLANINSDNYSSVDDAYILYRQNQFELEVSVPSLPSQLFIQNGTSFVAIDSFYFHIYAVKQTRKDDTGIPIVDNEDVAELIQHLSAREKKEVQVPPPMPVVNGQVIFSRLQFKSATLNNARTNPDQPHPNQQYFRLVLSLIVKIEDTFHFVMSRISPRLILRGRNPGNFNHSPSHEVPTPLAIDQPPQHSSRQTKRQRVPQQPPPQSQQQLTPPQQQPQPQPQQQPPSLQSEQQLQQQIQNQLAAMQQQQQQPMRMPPQQQQQQQVHTQRHVQLQLQQEMLQQQELLKQQELQNFLLQQQLESELNPHHPSPLMPAPNTTTTTTTTMTTTSLQPMMAPQSAYSPPPHSLPIPPQQAIPTHLQAPIIHPKREQDHDIQQQPLLQLSQSQGFVDGSSSSSQQQQNPRKSQKRTYLDAKMNQDPKDGVDEGWQMDSRGNIYLSGKVGINTLPTEEALTVHGNVLVTGNYLKPSDERVKTNIRALDGRTQLENIERLQLYEYDLKHERDKDGASLHETGVLAQELRKVLPQAVQVLQNVTLADGTIMPELLVVQDRALLYENIGATKQLGAEVRKNQANLTALQKRSQEIKAVTNRAFAAVGRSLDYLLTETGDDYTRDDIKAKWCYCTLFGLGPAWTIYFLGFIIPPLWLCGIFYISSFQHVKKLAGFFSAISLCLYIAYIALIFSMSMHPGALTGAMVSVAGLGIVLLFGPIAMSWGHKKQRRKYYKFTKKKVHKARLRKELGVVNEVLQEEEEEGAGTV